MAAWESQFYELGDAWSPPLAWARNGSVSHRFTEWCMAAWQDRMWTQSAAALTLLPAEHAAPSQAAVARYYKKVFGSKPELHGPMYDVKRRRGALRRTVAVVPVAMLIKESYAVLQSAASRAAGATLEAPARRLKEEVEASEAVWRERAETAEHAVRRRDQTNGEQRQRNSKLLQDTKRAMRALQDAKAAAAAAEERAEAAEARADGAEAAATRELLRKRTRDAAEAEQQRERLQSEVMADARETSAGYRLTALAAERKRAEAEGVAKQAAAERDAAQSEVKALRNKCNGLSSRLAATDRATRGAEAADVRAASARQHAVELEAAERRAAAAEAEAAALRAQMEALRACGEGASAKRACYGRTQSMAEDAEAGEAAGDPIDAAVARAAAAERNLPPRVRWLAPKAGAPVEPEIVEILRRIVSVGKVALQNVAAVVALAYTLFTGEVPPEEALINHALVKSGIDKLGVLDQQACRPFAPLSPSCIPSLTASPRTAPCPQDRRARWSAEKYGFALASDTGSEKHGAQYKGSVEVMARTSWSTARRPDGRQVGPVSEALGLRDLHSDQSAKHGTAVLEAAMEQNGLAPSRLLQVEGDSTGHAENQRGDLIKKFEEAGTLPADRAAAENCSRHLVVLEENGALGTAYPGMDDVAFLRTVHELIHKEVDFYRRLWGNRWGWSRGPMDVFKALSSMPLCTEAKWGVRAECARLFLRSATLA